MKKNREVIIMFYLPVFDEERVIGDVNHSILR